MSPTESMMNKIAIATTGTELIENRIGELLDRLIIYEKNAKADRKNLAQTLPNDSDDFTVLEEIELLTTEIRGYASQIKIYGRIKNEEEAIKILESKRIFAISSIAQWYFNSDDDYQQLKLYASMLDYLRLLILELIGWERN
ncbi:MAG: hypothetical protein SXA11_02505 [Cyanobacteriota bacterium]|nr:hypothetical protein [Cyanobacteriota bacterium]